MTSKNPWLFGIKNSNRDFSNKDTWWKNQFNSSFPASLCAFLYSKNLSSVYIKLDKNMKTFHDSLPIDKFFWENPLWENIFYSFETQYTPYQQLVIWNIPRIDLVTQSKATWNLLKWIEVKLTALPDNSTCELSEDKYGSEIVIRPDTIVYLACSIAINYLQNRDWLNRTIWKSFDAIGDWSEPKNIIPNLSKIVEVLDTICLENLDKQEPILMQPIWKTEWKSPKLAKNCLDVFVWSNLAFIQLFLDVARSEMKTQSITRQVRTIVWLFKMLFDFSKTWQIDHEKVIDELSYNTKNDKAFAISWRVSQPYMKWPNLSCPRITKDDIKNIILWWGQNLLSPERRFDAIIYNSPEIFN